MYAIGRRDGNIIATIPIAQIAVNNNRADKSNIPGIGIMDCDTTNHEIPVRTTSVPPKM
jgi:hypothetical protein